ncbi:thymidylate synthase, flavin-dependent [Pyrolobus fumarii 1A]|uniref:Flavin-dependent thymidylate synthase n=2 Tax=Pyrolobus fumarii TaxID=54252 RepID=G0EDV1_PYRF1|nr:thymidylate synthase, flavin-dependent [Pyrolobus fumarii 1A]
MITTRLVEYTRPCWLYAAAAAKMSASRRSFTEALSMNTYEAEVWLHSIILHGFTSVLEHCKYTFEVVCSRICSHQLVRHRIASYTQQSMRWSEGFLRDMALEACKVVGMSCPEKPRTREDYRLYSRALSEFSELINNGDVELREALNVVSKGYVIPPWLEGAALREMLSALAISTSTYYRLLSSGVPREDARFVIPNAVKTRLVVTMNARELLEVFLPLRLCTRAQWEIRLVAWSMLEELRRVEPLLWRWAGPRCLRVAQLAGAECTLDKLLEGNCKLPVDKCPEGVPRAAIPDCVKRARSIARL